MKSTFDKSVIAQLAYPSSSSVLTISWVLTHSGPRHFSPAPAWTILALAWDRPSCPCLEERGKHTVGVRDQTAGRWHWLMSHRQWLTQAMQWQPSQDVLAEGWWGGRMDSTPTWSVTPYLKDGTQKMAWSYCNRFQLWQVHTHTHPTHTLKQTVPVVAKLRVCVTQFGFCVRCSCSLGATTPISFLFFPSGWVMRKNTNTPISS